MDGTGLKATICVLEGLGIYGTWGRTVIDGTLARLFAALHDSTPYLLSSINEPLKTSITGIYWPVDYVLKVLILFFWEAVDGSHPTTSVVALYFASQHLSIVMTLYVDSYRYGHKGEWRLGATLWLMLFQLTAIGTSGPWFLAAYFCISPLIHTSLPPCLHRSLHLANPVQVLLLPFSITIGYIVPVILMAFRSPSVVSGDFKQVAIAVWNIFPLSVAATQTILPKALTFLGLTKATRTPKTISAEAEFLKAVRISYGFAFALSCACHAGVTAVSASSVLFPMIFTPQYASSFKPGKVFVPPNSWAAVSTFGEGDLSFMKWDQAIGYACMLLYAGTTYVRVRVQLGEEAGGWTLCGALIVGCLLSGPGSTVLACSWAKDELLLARQGKVKTSMEERD